MNKNKQIFELYIDYLVTSFSYATATGLSNLLDGEISHDQVTRFLSHKPLTSADLWRNVKKKVREIESDDGVLIFDDMVQEKPYSSENELISWHFDHTVGRSVKGINLLNCIYHSNEASLPVAFKLITKPIHPLQESHDELDDIFARQKTRKVSKALTLQYDKVVYLIASSSTTDRLVGKNVMVYDYPDGTVSIKHCGNALPYQVFDKLRQVNQGEVVDNKRLGAALAVAKRSQEERSETLERTRSSKNFSRTAQKKARQVNAVLLNPLDLNKSIM